MNSGQQQQQQNSFIPSAAIPNFSNFYLPFNPAFVELPEAKAEDLTPRSGWIGRVNDIEKKYIAEKKKTSDLREEIQQLQIDFSNAQSTSNLNLEQLSSYIISLEQEVDRQQSKIEEQNSMLKSKEEYILVIKETIKENEEKYLKHLSDIKAEYEKLEGVNKNLKERINELNTENQTLRLDCVEAKNETAKQYGIRDTEKSLIQNQLKETQLELTKANNKYFDTIKELERTKVLLEESISKRAENERQVIWKDNEITRMTSLVKDLEVTSKVGVQEYEKTATSKFETLTQKIRDEKSEIQLLYEKEQKTSYELRLQLDQTTKNYNILREENERLRSLIKIHEETIAQHESADKENMLRFNHLKAKYTSHFERNDLEDNINTRKLLRYREELESLKIEHDQNQKLIFQYQNFLKMHDLDYEFNNLTRFNHGNLNKISADLKQEARERAARDYYLEHQTNKASNLWRESFKEHDLEKEKTIRDLREEMDNISDHMEGEWRQLFDNLSKFKTKIGQ